MSKANILKQLNPNDRIKFLETITSLLYPFSESNLESFISLTKQSENKSRDIPRKKNNLANSESIKPSTYMLEPTGLERIDFNCLSLNDNILWTEKLIDKYKDKWNWKHLSLNESIIWTEKLIDKYENKWNWNYLSVNKSLPWSIDFIRKHKEKLSTEYNSDTLYECIFDNTGIEWSKQYILEFNDEVNWESLSSNPSLKITTDLLLEFEDKIDWYFFSFNPSIICIWEDKSFSKFKNKLNWDTLSANKGLPWSEDFVELNKDKIKFEYFSHNSVFKWTEAFIEEHKDKLDFSALSYNESIPWNEQLILKYKNHVSGEHLSNNRKIKWTEKLLSELEDDIDWISLSENLDSENLEDVLELNSNKLLWYPIFDPYFRESYGLSGNENILNNLFKTLNFEEINTIFGECLIEIEVGSDIKYNEIHKKFRNEITLSHSQYDRDLYDEPNYSLYDDPNYNDDFDIDQQGIGFDF